MTNHTPKPTTYAALAFIADERKRTIESLKAERDELVAALKPFTLLTSEGDDQMFGVYVDKHGTVRAKGSTLYDIERARAALAKMVQQ